MNLQPLDQVKSIIANALNQAANIRKSYQTFFIETIVPRYSLSYEQKIEQSIDIRIYEQGLNHIKNSKAKHSQQ